MTRQSQTNARTGGGKWPNVLLGLAAFIIATAIFNFAFMTKTMSKGSKTDELMARNAELEAHIRKLEGQLAMASDVEKQRRSMSIEKGGPPPPLSSVTPAVRRKADSINSYWWPSAEDGGGLLGRFYMAQHPADCSSPSTRFFVWRSKRDNERDTRGLTAWAHAAGAHLLHALTDADKIHQYGSRVLITDELLWPMAKGCLEGPETRECYFEPLTSCKLSDVNPMPSAASIVVSNATMLKNAKEEYDRSVRTVYTSNQLWFRLTSHKYSWTTLPGHVRDHSGVTMSAASLAYYFRPRPWLRKEIDQRIRRSMPADLNPDRTVGVPIRRSDKCHGHNVTGSAKGELDCPPLSLYLDGVRQFMTFDPLIENVIVTSEDKSACDEFLVLMNKELPSLRVVLNVGDVQQGTGSGSKVESYVEGATNANVVASALTSLHLHLRARYFIITSKSTWTSTIAVLARVYGFASEVFVLDIGRNKNAFSAYARSGCYVSDKERGGG